MEKNDILIIIILVSIFYIPFLNQAFHIDDTTSIYVANNLVKDPIKLYDGEIVYMGGTPYPLFRTSKTLVAASTIALSIIFSGSAKEILVHTLFMIYPIILGISMFYLSKKFTKKPLLATLLLMSTAMVMVTSHTAMTDIPMTALYTAAITLFIYGVDKNKTSLLVLAGIFSELSIVTKYQGLVSIILFGLYLILTQNKFKAKYIIPILIPIMTFALWSIHNIVYYGKVHFLSVGGLVRPGLLNYLRAAIGVPIYLGSISIFTLSIIYIYSKTDQEKTLLHFCIILSALFSYSAILLGYNVLHILMFLIFSIAGQLLIGKALRIDQIVYKIMNKNWSNILNIVSILTACIAIISFVTLLFSHSIFIQTGKNTIGIMYKKKIGDYVISQPIESWYNKVNIAYNTLLISIPIYLALVLYSLNQIKKRLRNNLSTKDNKDSLSKRTIKYIKKNSHDLFFRIWILGVLIYNVFIIQNPSAIYLLPMMPPITILFTNACAEKKEIKFLKYTILFTLIIGLIVSVGSYKTANVYRDFADNKISPYINNNENVYFTGHWGFQHHMERYNYKPLLSKYDSLYNAIIIKPQIPSPQPINDTLYENLILIDTIKYNSAYPIRTMNFEADAGFYSNGWGFLPYSVSLKPIEKFEVYKTKN